MAFPVGDSGENGVSLSVYPMVSDHLYFVNGCHSFGRVINLLFLSSLGVHGKAVLSLALFAIEPVPEALCVLPHIKGITTGLAGGEGGLVHRRPTYPRTILRSDRV